MEHTYIFCALVTSDPFYSVSWTEKQYYKFIRQLKTYLIKNRSDRTVTIATDDDVLYNKLCYVIAPNIKNTKGLYPECKYQVTFTLPLINGDTGKKIPVGYLCNYL